MSKYDQHDAECLIYTFKEGFLSKIAHDLKIRVTRFRVEVDEAAGCVAAEFDAGSLRVECAMRDGAEDRRALSPGDKEKIAGNIIDDVLHARRHPRVRFEASTLSRSQDGGYAASGQLELHGVRRQLEVKTELQGDRQVLSLALHQPDFGITPYKAMMGTLKVRSDVQIRLSLPRVSA
ncbi:MAG: YceI family protein [Proteobacteria bacterium]|nr:YceI family protein [Pseudomonadota bacterium]